MMPTNTGVGRGSDSIYLLNKIYHDHFLLRTSINATHSKCQELISNPRCVSVGKFIVVQVAKNLPDSIAYSLKSLDVPRTNLTHACYKSSLSRKSLLQYWEEEYRSQFFLLSPTPCYNPFEVGVSQSY